MNKVYRFSFKLYKEKYNLSENDRFNIEWAKEADQEILTVVYCDGKVVRAETESGYDVLEAFDCCTMKYEKTIWDED